MSVQQKTALLRMIDANMNRLQEAVRVCEDVTRFAWNARTLTAAFKKVRHDATKALLRLPVRYQHIVSARDSVDDCGKASLIVDTKKDTIQNVFIRNCKRAGEAARVLEEVTKCIDLAVASRFQKVRFAVYELEKKAAKRL